ncbi:hypothetical protein [Mycobacterium sp. OTB74]|jgi:hypothetical protein|uniref:hypothetical protein n=1 Tax=Mycobacterium sp. OTB74 TaxID=1853452 RepID=UPI00247638A9|nr:hypothetical protein [Mycobacterium sp. OTB74]MDH6243439.1 hypothetical protein [Mycobacterium sp. OTB74]
MRLATALVLASAVLAVAVTPTASADPTVLPEVPLPADGAMFTDNPQIVRPQLLHIESWSRMDPAPQLTLNFLSSSQNCVGAHVTVQETDQTVQVTLTGGQRPDTVGRMCMTLVAPAKIVVPLGGPVGDRAVLVAE